MRAGMRADEIGTEAWRSEVQKQAGRQPPLRVHGVEQAQVRARRVQDRGGARIQFPHGGAQGRTAHEFRPQATVGRGKFLALPHPQGAVVEHMTQAGGHRRVYIQNVHFIPLGDEGLQALRRGRSDQPAAVCARAAQGLGQSRFKGRRILRGRKFVGQGIGHGRQPGGDVRLARTAEKQKSVLHKRRASGHGRHEGRRVLGHCGPDGGEVRGHGGHGAASLADGERERTSRCFSPLR